MKRILLLTCMLVCLSAGAADYIGTMRLSSGYTLSDVVVSIDEQDNLTLHRVKFARMMPVRVDVVIPQVERRQVNGLTTLRGDSIIPTVGGKPHPDRIVTDLQGQADGQALIFHCRMGDKLLEYEGRLDGAETGSQ